MSGKPFSGRMVVFGAGAICQCALPIVLDRVANFPEKITVVEMDESKRTGIAGCLERGVKFEVQELEESMLPGFLEQRLSEGDILFDLAWEIDTVFLLSWCHTHGVIYLNTSLEVIGCTI
jgi:homospermidine synthase